MTFPQQKSKLKNPSHQPDSSRNSLPNVRKHQNRRFFRYLYLRFLRLKGTAQSIARGLAAGTFAGMFSIFGGQIIIGVLLAFLVRGNKVAAIAATWISNPLTYVPLYALNYHIGHQLLNLEQSVVGQQDLSNFNAILDHGLGFAVALTLGSFINGTVAALIAYWVGYHLSHRLKHRRRQRYRKFLEHRYEQKTK